MTNNINKKLESLLHELQCILDEELLLGAETQSHDSISKVIKQKLAFIGNLLGAEVASHTSMPHHLHHISERFSTLERNFHQWDSFRSLPSYHDCDKDSSCSCTESCLNDDGGDTDLFDSDCEKAMVEYSGYAVEEKQMGEINSFDYEDAFEDFDGEKELVEFDDVLVRKSEEEGMKDNDLEREERRDSTVGKKFCCALAGGVVIGMILMGFIMVNISSCFHYVEQVSFSVPT